MGALSAANFEKKLKDGIGVIDTRSIKFLKQGFIKGSILIPSLKLMQYALLFSGGLNASAKSTSLLLITEPGEEESQLLQLKKLGIKLVDTLDGGYETWLESGGNVDLIIDIEPDELMMDLPFDDKLIVADIRPAVVYANGHLKEAINLPIEALNDPLRLSAIEDNDNLYIVGDNNEECFLAASILKKHDIHNLRVVAGGWEAIAKQTQASIVKEPGVLN